MSGFSRRLWLVVVATLFAREAAATSLAREGAHVRVRLFSKALPSSVLINAPEGTVTCSSPRRLLKGTRISVRVATDRELLDGGLLLLRVADSERSDLQCSAVSVIGLRVDASVSAGNDKRPIRAFLDITQRDQTLGIFETLSLERYLDSVVQAEGGALPQAALEAQGIVSRSWALANLHRHGDFDFCDLTHCQWYRGDAPLAGARVALDATRGEVLARKGNVVSAFFHSSCGGATSSSLDIFSEPGVAGVSDLRSDGKPLCSGADDFEWSWSVAAKELGGVETGVTRVLRADAAGRAMEVSINGTRYAGPQLLADVTRRFGYQTLRSLKFSVERRGKNLVFKGRGVGHGVGFCQAGAAALAKDGKSAMEILKHYFPDAAVTKYPPAPP